MELYKVARCPATSRVPSLMRAENQGAAAGDGGGTDSPTGRRDRPLGSHAAAVGHHLGRASGLDIPVDTDQQAKYKGRPGA
jgi:hypothetical protein